MWGEYKGGGQRFNWGGSELVKMCPHGPYQVSRQCDSRHCEHIRPDLTKTGAAAEWEPPWGGLETWVGSGPAEVGGRSKVRKRHRGLKTQVICYRTESGLWMSTPTPQHALSRDLRQLCIQKPNMTPMLPPKIRPCCCGYNRNISSDVHHLHPQLSVTAFISLSLPHSSHSQLSYAPVLLLVMPVICWRSSY